MQFVPDTKLTVLLALLAGAAHTNADTAGQRYRGAYTLGHEVNVFCPDINSQCYWIGPNTRQAVRDDLHRIYRQGSTGLYEPVCVLVSGVIDRQSQRFGFAADTDGLITVDRVYGDCESATIVTHGDLQHHRWVLDAVDGSAVNAHDWPVLPELDFGERLFVGGGNGCRQFSGFSRLAGDRIVFDGFKYGVNRCESGRDPQGLFAIAGAWQVHIEGRQYLMLEKSGVVLKFRLDDWR